jgi:electron transport complex protein RnfD
MRTVLLALLPGIAAQIWVYGPGVALQIVLAAAIGLACEALMLRMRRLPQRVFLTDGSVVVTAVLFALAMPPLASWWLSAIGMAFAVIVAKHAYGGVGCNLFNPAMAGYALLLVCYPHEMHDWPRVFDWPPLTSTLFHLFRVDGDTDAISGATALEHVRRGLQGMRMLSEMKDPAAIGWIGARGGEWVNGAYLAGGIFLLATRAIRWQIPVGFLAGLTIVALALHLGDAERHASPFLHLFSGATMLGAFFIATDPVTSPVTSRGRFIFGVAIGLLVMIIRRFGDYPDGVAFAVLILNAAVPFIDRCTRPRVLGEEQG